jgi:hypothetical protein
LIHRFARSVRGRRRSGKVPAKENLFCAGTEFDGMPPPRFATRFGREPVVASAFDRRLSHPSCENESIDERSVRKTALVGPQLRKRLAESTRQRLMEREV